MPQVSLYIDQKVLNAARQNAKKKNISLSKYVTNVLLNDAESIWPEGYWDVFGSLDDKSFIRPSDTPFDQVANKMSFS